MGLTNPQIIEMASMTMSMLTSTSVCKQLLSLMNLNKSLSQTQLMDVHLKSTLKDATSYPLVPEIDMLVTAKRCQIFFELQCYE